MGMAKPTPSAVPDSLRICALTPITSPAALNIGPPEFPRLIGASVWIASTQVEARGDRVDRTFGRRDDAHAQRALLAEGAADRGHGLADDDGARVTQGHGAHRMVGWIDLEQADVVEEVPADDLGRDALSVPKLDVDGVGRRRSSARIGLSGGGHDVGVGEDVALVRGDEARPLGGRHVGVVDAALAEQGVDGDDAGRPLAVELGGVEAVPGERLRRVALDRLGRRRRQYRAWARARSEHGRRPRRPTRRPCRARARASLRGRRRRRRARRRRQGGSRPTHRSDDGPAGPAVQLATSATSSVWGCSGCASGRFNVKTVVPGREETSIDPPRRVASSEAMASPRPLPEALPPAAR